MSLSREKLFAALFKRLRENVPSVKTFTRSAQGFEKYGASQQPALVLLADTQSPQQMRGEPTRWRIGANVILYLRATPSIGDTAILSLIDEVEKALEVKQGEEGDGVHTTLGGLVSHCWMTGSVEIVDGDNGEQAVVVIPVEMLAVA